MCTLFKQGVMMYFPVTIADLTEEIKIFSFIFYFLCFKLHLLSCGSMDIKVVFVFVTVAFFCYHAVPSMFLTQLKI